MSSVNETHRFFKVHGLSACPLGSAVGRVGGQHSVKIVTQLSIRELARVSALFTGNSRSSVRAEG